MNANEAQRRAPVVSSGSSLLEVARVMADTGARAVVVTDDDGSPAGIVTERDLVVRAVAWNVAHDMPVDAVMTPDLVTAHPSASPGDVYRLLRAHSIKQLPLVQDGRVVGIVSRDDLVDEANAELIAGLRHCPRCGGEWLRTVSTAAARNFVCVLCRSCWHLQEGEFVRVETRSCPGCPEHNFCRFPLIDFGVVTSPGSGEGPETRFPRRGST
jgi:CBS domain-containing protein